MFVSNFLSQQLLSLIVCSKNSEHFLLTQKQYPVLTFILSHIIDENGKSGKVTLDPMTHIVFLDACIGEVHVNNRPNGCFNLLGYVNLISKFSERTKRNYECKRFKNRWSHSKRTVGTVRDATSASVVP